MEVFLLTTPSSLQRIKVVRIEDYGWKERESKFQRPATTEFFLSNQCGAARSAVEAGR